MNTIYEPLLNGEATFLSPFDDRHPEPSLQEAAPCSLRRPSRGWLGGWCLRRRRPGRSTGHHLGMVNIAESYDIFGIYYYG